MYTHISIYIFMRYHISWNFPHTHKKIFLEKRHSLKKANAETLELKKVQLYQISVPVGLL